MVINAELEIQYVENDAAETAPLTPSSPPTINPFLWGQMSKQ